MNQLSVYTTTEWSVTRQAWVTHISVFTDKSGVMAEEHYVHFFPGTDETSKPKVSVQLEGERIGEESWYITQEQADRAVNSVKE